MSSNTPEEENTNSPCEQCGSTENTLYFNYFCTDCFKPASDEEYQDWIKEVAAYDTLLGFADWQKHNKQASHEQQPPL